MSATKNQIMEQAQVFASAWSMVGGPFDNGDQIDLAGDEKVMGIRNMWLIPSLPEQPEKCSFFGFLG